MKGRGGMRTGAGRKGMWQNGETQTIRVPVALKDDLVTLGQQLDRGRGVIAGKVRIQLEAVLAHWQAESSLHPEESWQPVRKLLGELETILAETYCQGRGRHGMGADQNQHRHQHQNQHPCSSAEFSGATPDIVSDLEPAIDVSVS
jgi:hypothetical protein